MLQSETVRKYDTYKDSGSEWIGRIPQEWKFAKLAWCSNFVNGYAFNSENMDIDGEVPVVRIGDIQNSRVQYETCLKVDSSEELKPYELKVNDVVIAMSGATTGKLAVICDDKQAYINQRVGIIRSKYNKFIRYCLDNESFMQYVALLSAGSAQPNISMGNILDYKIPYISVEEQQQIADYLDKKCGDIDRVVETEKSVIEKLKEYKQSIITEAVTKGLDKSTPLKDSGIEWIGKIPQHWEVRNSRRFFKERKERLRNDDKQLTASQKYGIIAQEEFMKLENQKVMTVFKGEDILKHVEPNDFVISMRSFQGGIEHSRVRGCISSAYVMLIPNDKIYPLFYKWVFKSITYIQALQSTSNLIRDGQAMRFNNFVQVPIMLLPKEEQQQIAEYLDKKCSEIDKAIADKEQVIEKFTEYKKSLIYECVTGKRKVVE